MALKRSLYNEVDVEELKIQLKQVIELLEYVDPHNLEDRIGERYVNGNILPYVVSTIEDQLRAVMSSVKVSAGLIIAIFNKEGNSEDLQNDIEITLKKLEEIREYYSNLRHNSITDRKLWLIVGYKGRGKERVAVESFVVVQTRERQIEFKNKFSEEILKISPQINIIKSYSNVSGRGGVEIGESMTRFLKRIKMK